MGNFIFATVLLSIVIIFTGVNSFIICELCDEMIELIDAGYTEEACAIWKENRTYISIFVRDAEIDVVNTEVEAMEGVSSIEDGEAEAGRMRLREAVAEILDSEKVSLADVF